jgi:hypothetical protein
MIGTYSTNFGNVAEIAEMLRSLGLEHRATELNQM